jgi:hypothetical protein
MMNPEVKAKWLEALRSGEYKQTRHTLRSCTDGFCCLGVLSDIYRKEVGGSWQLGHDGDDTVYSIVNKNQDDCATVELPDCIKHWAEVDACNPQVHLKKEDDSFGFVSLATLNDEGKTFNEIADLIEKQL